MGVLPDRWNEYFDKPLWPNRIAYYSLIFVVIFSIFFGIHSIITTLHSISDMLSFIFHIQNPIFSQYNATELSNNGFYDNERYLLSALVQSLAAVIALVITLSLVAVQLAAQSYSARVIDVYKRNPDMWILLGIYIITIFYGLGLIKIVGLGVSGINMEGAIFAAYFMGFFAFVCMIPYMLKTLDLLKPLTLIQLLAEDITKEKILNHLKINGQKGEEDPVLPIVDVTYSALMRNDDETVRNGILEIKNTTLDIFEFNHFKEMEEENISKYLIQHLERIGIQAADNKNEISSISTILALGDIKRKITEFKLEKATQETVKSIGNMQIKVLQQKFENATEHIIKIHKNDGIKELEYEKTNIPSAAAQILAQICMKAIEQNMDLSASVGIQALRDLGLKAVEIENILVSVWIIGDIDNIGRKAATNGNDFVAKTVVKALENIVVPILDKNKGFLLERVLYALDNISVVAIDKKLESTIDAVTEILGIVATEAISDEDFAINILKKLEIISTETIDKGLENAFMSTAIAIKNVGIKAVEQKLETIIIEIAEILEKAEGKAAEKKLIQAQWIAIDVLKDIGVKAAENQLEEATKKYEIGLKTLMQKTDVSDDMQKMFIDPAIEKALHSIEKAKSEEDT